MSKLPKVIEWFFILGAGLGASLFCAFVVLLLEFRYLYGESEALHNLILLITSLPIGLIVGYGTYRLCKRDPE